MTDLAPVHNICADLNLELLAEPDERSKFLTAPVTDTETGDRYHLKVVKGGNHSAWEDLENEHLWLAENHDYLVGRGYHPPEVIKTDPYSEWALFEQIDGETLTELEVRAGIGDLAMLGTIICLLPLGRDPLTSIDLWLKRRFRNNMDIPSNFLTLRNQRTLESLSRGIIPIAGIVRAGTIQGDFKPGNIIKDSKGILAPIDPEFGTLLRPPHDTRQRRRTEHDKPRYHDLAYMFHLLWVQYQDPALAREFAARSYEIIARERGVQQQAFKDELVLSVIERTLSMANHFVFRRDESKQVDDMRRTDPESYKDLLNFMLDAVVSPK